MGRKKRGEHEVIYRVEVMLAEDIEKEFDERVANGEIDFLPKRLQDRIKPLGKRLGRPLHSEWLPIAFFLHHNGISDVVIIHRLRGNCSPGWHFCLDLRGRA